MRNPRKPYIRQAQAAVSARLARLPDDSDIEIVRSAPEGSKFPGRAALSRLGRGSALRVNPGDKMPAPERVPVTVYRVSASKPRPLPIVYGFRVTREGRAAGPQWLSVHTYPDGSQSLRSHEDKPKAAYTNPGESWVALPLPWVTEWRREDGVRTGEDWQGKRPAFVFATWGDSGSARLTADGANRVLERMASRVIDATPAECRCRACLYPTPRTWTRDAIIARHLPRMARVQIRRAA